MTGVSLVKLPSNESHWSILIISQDWLWLGAVRQQAITRASIDLGPYRHIASPDHNEFTHWGRVTHICVGKSTIIGSDNGLSPDRHQAIVWANAGILIIGPLGTYFSENITGIQAFSFKKMHLKMSSAKWRPFCLGLNVVNKRGSRGLQPVCILAHWRVSLLAVRPRNALGLWGHPCWGRGQFHLRLCRRSYTFIASGSCSSDEPRGTAADL